MTYTKQTFEMVASILRETSLPEGERANAVMMDRARLAEEFAIRFKMSNAAFDRRRFFQACGVEEF